MQPSSSLFLAVASVVAMGCSVSVPPRAPRDDDPSNPAAPSAPFDARPSALAKDVSAAEEKPAAKDTVYQCPMHSDVVREEPGVCPKCGMTLEPKPRPK